MRKLDFSRLGSLQAISHNFGVTEDYLKSVITSPHQFYTELRIPKKGRNRGKYRVVYKAADKLAHLQSEISTHIGYNVYNKDNTIRDQFITKHAYGFVKNKGILQNARLHLAKKYLLSVDIKDFFKSIIINDVYHVFLKIGAPSEGAEVLASLCTLNSRLEEGLHTSPIISNLHCFQLDMELAEFCKNKKCSFSRYADDFAFSSNHRLPSLNVIEEFLLKYKFEMNKNKTRYSKRGQAQYVTGLSVTDDKYPRIPRPIKRQLRTELHYIQKFGAISHFYRMGIDDGSIANEICRIEGWIRYISGIEPEVGNRFQIIFDEYLT